MSVFFAELLPVNDLLDGLVFILNEVRKTSLPAQQFQENDPTAPNILLVSLLITVGLRSVEDGILPDGSSDNRGSDTMSMAKTYQFDEECLAFFKGNDHYMLRVDGFVSIAFFMAIFKGNQNLPDYFDDRFKVVAILLAEQVANAFSGYFFHDHVEKAVLIKIFRYLDDVRVA